MVDKTWLLHRNQFGRRFKNMLISAAISLKDSGFVGKKLNVYFEKTQVAPLCLAIPVITGTPAVGQTLTCSNGTWAGQPAPTLTKQWMKDSVNIAGATGNTYVIAAGDAGSVITCKVTGTNAYGTYFAVASGVSIPAADEPAGETIPPLAYKPANQVLPWIEGDTISGVLLTVQPGTWDAEPAADYAYQWKVDSQAVPGEISATFLLSEADVGGLITCTVTASNSEGSSQRTTVAVGPVDAA